MKKGKDWGKSTNTTWKGGYQRGREGSTLCCSSPYKPPIAFSQIFVEAKIGIQSNRYVEIMEKILTNVSLTQV